MDRIVEPFPEVQVLPGVDRATFLVGGVERVAYVFGAGSKRPYLFPVLGPSGATLTRMGHPNPVGHEHHKSVWFGHQKVNGVNFWEERGGDDVSVRHRRVIAYEDGRIFGGLAADIDWWAGGRSLLRHRLIVVLEPAAGGQYALDLQSRFEAVDRPVELGRTNFGFLGVRVAKTVSEQFGGGTLRNDRGDSGESDVFGQTSRWVDYSGPTRPGVIEGVTYFDHPDNPGHPSAWHVRRDGWMSSAFNLRGVHGVAPDHPLDLRYRLLVHSGEPRPDELTRSWQDFARLPPYEVVDGRGKVPAIRRKPPG